VPTFSTWLLIWLTLIYLPRILLTGVHWIGEERFLKAQPDKEWLFSGFKLFLILWLPLSFIATARHFQESPTNLFYLFALFIPSIGIGLFKGLIETVTGISWFYGWRLTNEPVIISYFPFGRSFVRVFWYHFTLDHRRVRWVGIIRLVMNTAVLITLLLFF
jgi:hypothetical protein